MTGAAARARSRETSLGVLHEVRGDRSADRPKTVVDMSRLLSWSTGQFQRRAHGRGRTPGAASEYSAADVDSLLCRELTAALRRRPAGLGTGRQRARTAHRRPPARGLVGELIRN